MNPPAAKLYPAAQIAAALGLSKRAVLARLDADAAGVVMVRGQPAAGQRQETSPAETDLT